MAGDTRARLVRSMAHAELLRERHDQQREALVRAAGKMADHATGHVETLRDDVVAGDTAPTAHARRALEGRYLARQLVGGGA